MKDLDNYYTIVGMADNNSVPIIKLSKYGENIDKNHINNADNIELQVTPPARENTEVDISVHGDEEENGYAFARSSAVRKDFNALELTLGNNENGLSDSENDVENVLREMEKIVNFDHEVRFAAGDDDYDTELYNLAMVRKDGEDTLWRAGSRETYTATPRDNWSFTTRSIPELNFTWNSTVNSTQYRSVEIGGNSRYTNQYLRSTASIFTNGRTKRLRKREKSKVTWNNRAETRSDGRKLFCFDQFEEMQIENASRQPERTDMSISR